MSYVHCVRMSCLKVPFSIKVECAEIDSNLNFSFSTGLEPVLQVYGLYKWC